MFTEKFGSYACPDQTISCEIDGFTVTAQIKFDDSSCEPWKECDGHGLISEWTSRDKYPGERVLIRDHGLYRYYDFREAVKIAKRDAWGCENSKDLTKNQIAAQAAEENFIAMKAWCDNEWFWCGIVLSVARNGVELDDHAASLWSIECNYPGSDNSYLNDVANDLLEEALTVARQTMAKLIADYYTSPEDAELPPEVAAQMQEDRMIEDRA